ncbi:kinase-like protein, partial [Polyplosphaeria fusca]
RFPIFAFLGRGAHGFVDTVQEYKTGKLFARKQSGHGSLCREVKILRRLSHPHIVRFVAAYVVNSSLNLIISPVAQSTLQHYLSGPIDVRASSKPIHAWIGCLSSALAYIHSQRIRHADIKPHNILIQGEHEVFISDFGVSRVVSESDSTSSSISPLTPLYAPLEIKEHLPHGRKADIFSLGCVVLELLTFGQGRSVHQLQQYL